MPILLGLLGLGAVACLWVLRARRATETTRDLAHMADDVLAAARRLGFRRQRSIHPVDLIDDPALAIGALTLAIIELGTLPTALQRQLLIASLQAHLGKTVEDATEILILGRWIVTQCNGPEPAIDRLLNRLVTLDRAGSFDPLMAVLNDAAKAGPSGEINDRQMDALTEIARYYKIR